MLQITNRKKFIALTVAAIISIVALGWRLWGGTTIKKSGEVLIESGTPAREVWRTVVAQGYSERQLPWRYYSWRAGAAARLKAGEYHIEQGETIPQVIGRMVSGDIIPDELALTFPEGFTIEQMAARTEAKGLGTAEEFVAEASPQNFSDQYPFVKDIPSGRSLEGYLFPDTYQVFDDDSPRDVILRQLTTFNRKVTSDLQAEAHAAGRTLDHVVIMASIIEREVISEKDMAVVSGILWKRLNDGVGLDADATIRYVLKKWDGRLTVEDLRTDSPYNTRRYRGLPPGPISNPGLQALLAAIRPEASEYYYYLSTPEGETIFAKTNDEHNANKAKYLK